MNSRSIWLTALLWAGAAASQASPRLSPEVIAGRRIAQQNCGGCHAVGAGKSPLADAPPFRRLYLRYGTRTLGDMLQEGMLAPPEPQDEALATMHPRMAAVRLDDDAVANLTAYLKSLEPFRRTARPQ
jgi:mono/diheme cytochrome c family protein